MRHVNIYRSAGQWCYALWIDGEHDHSDTLPDCDSEEEARADVVAMWPDATIERVDDV